MKECVTIRSRFHGGGIASRHKSLDLAVRAAETWKSSPGLAIARIVDGQYYRQYYVTHTGFVEFGGMDETPIPDRLDNPNGSAYDYVL